MCLISHYLSNYRPSRYYLCPGISKAFRNTGYNTGTINLQQQECRNVSYIKLYGWHHNLESDFLRH